MMWSRSYWLLTFAVFCFFFFGGGGGGAARARVFRLPGADALGPGERQRLEAALVCFRHWDFDLPDRHRRGPAAGHPARAAPRARSAPPLAALAAPRR